jgi:hypothetical protein
MLVNLETVMVQGAPHPLTATMNLATSGFEQNDWSPAACPIGIFPDALRTHRRRIRIPQRRATFVIRSGLESVWTTVAQ